jgi:hypothetical protein
MRRPHRRLPILLCFDVEPDPRVMQLDEKADWVGFELLVDFVNGTRPRLAEASGAPVRFNWFLRMDPQVGKVYGSPSWVVDRYGAVLEELEAAGDEIGLHIHPWRWEDDRGWVADFEDPEWGRFCVETGFAAYAETIGRPCRSVRFGDRWLTADIQRLAASLGARYDLTVEPGHRPAALHEPTIGLMPDYSPSPHRPYRPSASDPTRAGGGLDAPWVIPLSTHPLSGLGQPYSHRIPRLDEAPPRGAGPFRGWIDLVDSDVIAGWAWDESTPDEAVEVAVFDGDRCMAVVPASEFRGDLVAAGIGDGTHAFFLPVGEGLRDGRSHQISARIVGSDYRLGGDPPPLRCAPLADPDADRYPIDLCYNSLIVRPSLDYLSQEGRRPHLALVTRTHVMLPGPDLPHFLDNYDHLQQVARRAPGRFVTPEEALGRRSTRRRLAGMVTRR